MINDWRNKIPIIYACNESKTLFASEKLPSTAVISMSEHTHG